MSKSTTDVETRIRGLVQEANGTLKDARGVLKEMDAKKTELEEFARLHVSEIIDREFTESIYRFLSRRVGQALDDINRSTQEYFKKWSATSGELYDNILSLILGASLIGWIEAVTGAQARNKAAGIVTSEARASEMGMSLLKWAQDEHDPLAARLDELQRELSRLAAEAPTNAPPRVERKPGEWYSAALCDSCYDGIFPGASRDATRLVEREPEDCADCGLVTLSGIYVRRQAPVEGEE